MKGPDIKVILLALPVCLAVCHTGCLAAGGEVKPLKVVVCARQSNMLGNGEVPELPDELKKPQPNVLFFDGTTCGPISPGKTSHKSLKFGPEISFGHRYQSKIGEPIGIIKHSVGTTSLAVDWSPSRTDSLYHQLFTKIKAAQQSRDIEIVAMLWMQGERDTTKAKWANAYAKNLANLIKTARKDFKKTDMYFVAGRVNPPRRKLSPIVRKAQEQCKEKGYAWIDCDDLEGAEKIHYTSNGYVQMGYKFADALLNLMTSMIAEQEVEGAAVNRAP